VSNLSCHAPPFKVLAQRSGRHYHQQQCKCCRGFQGGLCLLLEWDILTVFVEFLRGALLQVETALFLLGRETPHVHTHSYE
jgi:hypothetical protein